MKLKITIFLVLFSPWVVGGSASADSSFWSLDSWLTTTKKSQPKKRTIRVKNIPLPERKLNELQIHPQQKKSVQEVAELSGQAGQVFLVDHYLSAGRSGRAVGLYKKWLAKNHLGGIIFWNGDKLHGLQFQNMLRGYRTASERAGQPVPILSIDYEEKRVQRISQREGFTKLLSGSTLGASVKDYGYKLCRLHGELIGKELGSVGFNMAMSTVSDIYRPNSRTRGMFKTRAISSRAEVIVRCIQEMVKGSKVSGRFAFVTKHFPGLGSMSGNTDEGTKSSRASMAEEAENLSTFKAVIGWSQKARDMDKQLALMSSNGAYPFHDSSMTLTPESPKILQDLLRRRLGYKNVIVSDALWFGTYAEMIKNKEFELYNYSLIKIFMAGMDLLMIPAPRFPSAYKIFQGILDNKIDKKWKSILVQDLGFRSWSEFRSKFKNRFFESRQRIYDLRKYLAKRQTEKLHSYPGELTSKIRKQYYGIGKNYEEKWHEFTEPTPYKPSPQIVLPTKK